MKSNFLIFTNWKEKSVVFFFLITCIIFLTEQLFHSKDASEGHSNYNSLYL